LVVSNHWEQKGKYSFAGIFVDRQVDSLKRMGLKVSIFDVGVHQSAICSFRRLLNLRQIVQQVKPDLLHAQYGTLVALVAAFGGKPLVISFCGNDLQPGATVSPLRMRLGFLLSNLAALRARKLICKSEELRNALWWRKKQAVVIPSGVDLELFTPGSKKSSRDELGWKPDRPMVLFSSGRDHRMKGFDLVKNAMDIVRLHIPDCEMHVISNVEPQRMPIYYRAADALVCASIREGSPNVVKEAMACNLPVVSVRVGDVAERLSGVYPGEVVSRDAKSIADAVVKVLRKRQRSNGREHLEHLSLDRIATRVLQVYRSALGETCDQELGMADLRIVPLTDGSMVRETIHLHEEAFAGYLNRSLGRNYIKAFLRWFIARDRAIALAAVDQDHKVVGYAIGAPIGYDVILNRELFWVVVGAVTLRPWLFLRPSFWRILKARLLTLLRGPSGGQSSCELPQPKMSLVAIGVDCSLRRRGVGVRLMQEFMARARNLGMRSLILSVREDRLATRRFYEKCGWRPCANASGRNATMKYCRLVETTGDDVMKHESRDDRYRAESAADGEEITTSRIV